MKHVYSFVFALAMIFATSLNAQTQVDTITVNHSFQCTFEDSAECSAWTLVNGGLTNAWYIGQGANNTQNGSTGLYISGNGGASHYYNSYAPSTVYAYRDIYLEAGYYVLYYEWKCGGDYMEDFLLAALVPGSVQFTPSTTLPADISYTGLPDGWINTGNEDYYISLRGCDGWCGTERRITITEPGMYHLVYVWHNSGNISINMPAAIDNINMYKSQCPWVANLRTESTTDSSITLAWTPQGNVTQWQFNGPTGTFIVDDTIITITGLDNNTCYWFDVYPFCNNGTGYGTSISEWTDCGEFYLPYDDNYNRSWSRFRKCCYLGGSDNRTPGIGWINELRKETPRLSAYYSIYGTSEYSYFALPQIMDSIDRMILECDFINEENSITYTSMAVVGIMSDPEDFSTFVGIDTIDMHDADYHSVFHYRKSLAGYGALGNHIAFAAVPPPLYGETYAYNNINIDNIFINNVEACSYISDFKVLTGDNYVTLDWKDAGTTNNWLLDFYGWHNDSTFTLQVQDTHVVVTGLEFASNYRVSLRALCSNGDTGTVFTKDFITLCAPITHSDLPYYTSFEDKWLDDNGNINYCWRWRNFTGTTSSPMIYGSYSRTGYNALYFQSSYGDDYSYAVLPMFEDSLNHLALSFYAKYLYSRTNARLAVGVMSAPDDIATFDTVEIIEPGAVYQNYKFTFDTFAFTDRHIALLFYSADRNDSEIIIDDLMVYEDEGCNDAMTLHLYSTDVDSAFLSWHYNGNATEFEVAWDYFDFDPNYASHIDTVTGNSHILTNFDGGNNHIVVYIRPLCQNSNVLWQGPVDCYLGITMVPAGSTDTLQGCQFTVFDNGYLNNYSDYSDGKLLLLPPDTTKSFAISGTYYTQNNYDYLDIYDGSTTDSPLLAHLYGYGTLDTIYSRGPVLFHFYSNSWSSYDGFEMNVGCIDIRSCPQVASVKIDRVSTSSAQVSWTMPNPDIDIPDTFLVRWADTTGIVDSLYVSGTSCFLTNLAAGTSYTVWASSICNGALKYVSANFRTANYGCISYDTTTAIRHSDTIGNNDYLTTSYLPSYSFYNYSYTQQLFLNSELEGGMITSISLMPQEVIDNRIFRIYLAHTTENDLIEAITPSDMTLVFSGGETDLTANEWVEFELTTPFNYNGIDNLLITFIDSSGRYYSPNRWYCHNTNHNSIFIYQDSGPYTVDDISNYSNWSYTSSRNNIVFNYSGSCEEIASCSRPDVWITEIGDDHIDIAWMPDSCAHNWNVEHRELGTEQWITDLTATTQTSYSFTGLQSYTSYQFRVTNGNNSSYSTVLNARTKCSSQSVPFVEDFTNYEYSDNGLPVCWSKRYRTYNREPWINSSYALRGNQSIYFYSSYNENYFTLPKLEAPMDSLTLYFSMLCVTEWGENTIQVGVMTNPDDITTFHPLGNAQSTLYYEWENFKFSLAGMPEGNIAFVCSGDVYNYLYLDAFEVLYNNPCSRPEGVHVTHRTATTATVEWMPTGASEYIVVCRDRWNDADSGITVVTQNPRASFTGLSGSQQYRVLVTAICAPGDTSYTSMDYIFETACSINDVPFTETFENYSYGTSVHAPYCWYYGSYHENYPFISRSYNHTPDGYNSMYLYCYDKDQEGHTTYMTLPELELDTLTMSDLQAVFYGYAQNTGSQHQLIVGVCDTAENINSFTPVDTVIIEPNKWDIYEVTFDNYTGNGKYITFVSAVAPSNKYSYPYLDDLTIEPIPPCQRPNNLYANEESATANTIEIGWNDRSGATQWIVEYGDKGFTPGTGTQVIANSNPFTLTGIHRGYEGEFYVKAVCSNESSSDWSRRPCTFKTVCDTMSDIVVACDSYTWHGTTYNSSITGPLYDAPDIPSCDSLVVLRLTIKHSTEGTEAQSACDSYTWYGNTYTTSTTAPTHHLTNAVGCDSTAHLSLTIRYSTEGTESQTACDSYTWYGNTYTASTTAPTHLLTNAVGCDSTAHLNLTMKYSTTATEQVVTCDRSSYTWRGQTFTESTNSATYTLPNAVGCDSVITLHLNMSHSDTGIETVDVCDSYTWHGNTYTASTNTATYETNTVTGCDSTVTLHLTVRYSNAANFSHIACDSYTWHGNTYTASTTTPTYTSTNIAGCDSTTTLLLTILNSTSSNDVVSACDSYQWHGTTYTASTSSPSFITTNAAGCDSVIHLNLTVRYSSEGTLTLTACDSYTWHGTTYTASTNTPTWLTLNNAGCDSLVTLNLTVNYSNTGIDNQTVCDSYTWHGNTYTASTNTPTYMSTNIMGCDSTTTLHLTVNYSNSGIETVSECDSYLWHGTVYTASTNTPTYLSTNAAGCDSTTTLHLTLNYSSSSIDNVTACDSYRWHGIDYTTSTNTPTFATTNAVGCDSTVVLHLTVNYSNTGIDNQIACDSYTWHGITYTASIDTVTFVETNAAGCDSTVTLHLTVNYSNTGSESATACDSYTWHGNTYTVSGTPTYQTTNAAGCDSTVTLTLTINNSTSSTVTQTACDSYTWHGNTYTVSGTPIYQTTNAAGCDSTVTLTLTINNSTTSTVTQTACDSYTWNGNTFTSSDTAVYQTTNAAGCDSTATLYLTVNFSSTSSETATECDSYTWNGETYTESGTYTYQTSNAAGCDSTVTMYLTVNFSSTSSEAATECDSYTWNGETYTESGTYTYQTSNAAGCDSTATLMLTVNYSSQVTIADTATGSYEWNGETYTESGTYTWTGTNSNGCDSTVTLHLYIQEVGINTVDNENAVNVYPNPTSGVLNIDADGITAIEVYDINGRLVATFGAVNKINIATLPAGAYTIRIKTTQNHHIRRIILK